MTLQKQLEYIHREFLVDTQWVEDQLSDPKTSIAEVDYDFGSRNEMKKERIKKTYARKEQTSCRRFFLRSVSPTNWDGSTQYIPCYSATGLVYSLVF